MSLTHDYRSKSERFADLKKELDKSLGKTTFKLSELSARMNEKNKLYKLKDKLGLIIRDKRRSNFLGDSPQTERRQEFNSKIIKPPKILPRINRPSLIPLSSTSTLLSS